MKLKLQLTNDEFHNIQVLLDKKGKTVKLDKDVLRRVMLDYSAMLGRIPYEAF